MASSFLDRLKVVLLVHRFFNQQKNDRLDLNNFIKKPKPQHQIA